VTDPRLDVSALVKENALLREALHAVLVREGIRAGLTPDLAESSAQGQIEEVLEDEAG
jgi:hypothetical protein